MVYMGSKAKLASRLGPIIQAIADLKGNYIEPFGGGLNMYTYIKHKNKFAYDINPYLVALLNGIVEGRELPDLYDRDTYHLARVDWPHGLIFDEFTLGAYGFLSTFGARWFGSHINVKPDRDDIALRMKNVKTQMKGIKTLNFMCASYDEIPTPGNSCYYLDPPYKGTTGYTAAGEFDYDSFLDWARGLASDKSNVVLLSEYTIPEGGTVLASIPHRSTLGGAKNAISVNEYLIAL